MKRTVKTLLPLLFCVLFVCSPCAPAQAPAAPSQAPAAPEQTQAAAPAAPADPAPAELPSIGMTVYSYANTYTSFIRKGIVNYIEDNKLADIQVSDAENDAAKQIEQIDAYIAQGVDALLVMPVDPASAVTMVDKAKAASIPLIFINKRPSTDILMSYDKTIFVGLPLVVSGEMQGQMVVDHWKNGTIKDRNGDGVMQYCTVTGDVGHVDAEARVQGNLNVFQKSGIEYEELDRQVANWDTTKAKEVSEIWVGKWPNDLDIIISNNDAMALGVLETIKQTGVDIPVVGINCLPQVHDMIFRGEYFGSVLSDPWKQAKAAVDLALNAINGKDWFDGNEWEADYDGEGSVRITDVQITAENLNLAVEAYVNCN
ncbi:MAG TPA: galactose ABC transporter substrate-binding protein [Feifaniaceae bacterium]|nr:galactose ABC transporter substrate-binding protein [Feifaniaceae bacterium]